jgi:hypothetical protein
VAKSTKWVMPSIALLWPSFKLMAAAIKVRSTITDCTGVMAIWKGVPLNKAMASIMGTVRITVDNEAPIAILTTDCMRSASAARIAVRISGQAEIAATTRPNTMGGMPKPAMPVLSAGDMASATAAITTMPTIKSTMD